MCVFFLAAMLFGRCAIDRETLASWQAEEQQKNASYRQNLIMANYSDEIFSFIFSKQVTKIGQLL